MEGGLLELKTQKTIEVVIWPPKIGCLAFLEGATKVYSKGLHVSEHSALRVQESCSRRAFGHFWIPMWSELCQQPQAEFELVCRTSN